MAKSIGERFWSKVDRRGPDECWPWLGAVVGGYGQFAMPRTAGKQKRIYANRMALLLSGVALNDEELALHTCSLRRCCNPAHLYPGGYSQNTADAIRAGTHYKLKHQRGESNPSRKLKEEDVIAIRDEVLSGSPYRRIADQHGVTHSAIWKIVTRRTWAHV